MSRHRVISLRGLYAAPGNELDSLGRGLFQLNAELRAAPIKRSEFWLGDQRIEAPRGRSRNHLLTWRE